MGCFGSKRHYSPPRAEIIQNANHKEEIFLQIPGASVHLMEGGETVELAKGDLTVLGLSERDVLLATAMKVGPDLQWPLTRDEPVVKLDDLHYLFSLPGKDGEFLNYGLSFSGRRDHRLASLDEFLKENACFSVSSSNPSSSSSSDKKSSSSLSSGGGYWSNFAPKIEDYNGLLTKAIAGGTGEIVKGIFMCSDVYAGQVQKGADLIQLPANNAAALKTRGDTKLAAGKKRGSINTAIHRVKKLSEMTEKMSRSLLNGVVTVTGSVTTPIVRSQTGKALLSSVPGQVLLASLDAINKVLDAVEAAEKRTLTATGNAVAGTVSQRFGESAGEATKDVFATAGHTVGTAWNIFKIRKVITPSSSSVASSLVKSAVSNRPPPS